MLLIHDLKVNLIYFEIFEIRIISFLLSGLISKDFFYKKINVCIINFLSSKNAVAKHMVWSVRTVAEAVKIVNSVITWSDVVRMVVTEDGTVPSARTVRDINTKCYELLTLTFYKC